ncbi:MAG: class I SAM-dependent methyltransferase [Acidobacteriota bacterium]
MSTIQTRADQMLDENGFLGVPRETFEAGGRAQFVRLMQHGLLPESRVLEIGCGCLRVAYWLTRFLDSGCYAGIEPAHRRVELGRRHLFAPGELEAKSPRFDHNAEFATGVFETQFDYFLAGSIWTHCSKAHIRTMLEGFLRWTPPGGIFLTSYLPAESPEQDYMGGTWVGTSHESDVPGVIRHSLAWIEAECALRGLSLEELPGLDCDSQLWLRIERRSA